MKFKSFLALKNGVRGFFSLGELERLGQAEVMLWCHDINRNHLHKGLFFSSITDSLNDKFIDAGLSTLTVARPYSGIAETDCYGIVYRVNGIIARAILLDYLIGLIKKFFKAPRSWLNINFQIIAWELILRRINPKIIIGIEPIKELCIAARNNNIPTFDVQHGIQIDTEGERSGHFYRMEYRKLEQNGWPDFVACWDQNSTDLLRKYRGEYTKLLTLGHPWAMRFLLNKNKKDLLVNEASSVYELESKLPVILYSLQYSRDDNGNTDSFVAIPEELDRFIKTEGCYFTWWLRIHPQLLRDEFRQKTFDKLQALYGGYNNVSWREATYAPLPYVLSKTSLHLTRNSSVVKEAAYFGIKSGLFEEPHMRKRLFDEYRAEIENGNAEIIIGYKHIKDFIGQECFKLKHVDNNKAINAYESALEGIVKIAKRKVVFIPNFDNETVID